MTASSWRITGHLFELHATIPPNDGGTIRTPGARQDGDSVVVEPGSGECQTGFARPDNGPARAGLAGVRTLPASGC